MCKPLLSALLLISCLHTNGQQKAKRIKGMYFQWGYNTEWYSKSNIHFKLSNGSNFVLHKVSAHDKRDFDAIYKKPFEISIPQYNYRVGIYINDKKTKSIELNFDHTKYVVTNFQKVHVTGTIENIPVNADSILNPATFLHLEHTDGANWFHVNFVRQKTIRHYSNRDRPMLNLIGKLGAGINVPRTDFTWKGDRYNNDFHIAGYNLGVEGGLRYYFLKKFFVETTFKTGYVRYVNALANTKLLKGDRVTHGFGYFECIGLVGYDINFK